jgi:outer membrane receptor for ferrienterochelin and colicins
MKIVGAAPVYYSTTNTISERSVVDGYTLADITVNKNIFHNKLSLTLGIKNLFNVTNLNAVNNNVSVHNSATGIAVARGRFLMTSVQWQIFSNRNKE